MIEIIQKTDLQFNTTPRSGWQDGKFYLISLGRGMKRVYNPTCEDLPLFAIEYTGCPNLARENINVRKSKISKGSEEKKAYLNQDKNERQIAAYEKSKGHEFIPSNMVGGEKFCNMCQVVKDWHA